MLIIPVNMIRINTLCKFEEVNDCYYLSGYNVINIKLGTIKKVSITNRGYPYVTLETKDKKHNRKALMHHIIALAYISNREYKYPEVIEHLNDNKMDYRVENLMFSNQFRNIKRAFENGHPNRTEKIVEVITSDDIKIIGTIKDLAKILNIKRWVFYDALKKKNLGKYIKNITEIKSTD